MAVVTDNLPARKQREAASPCANAVGSGYLTLAHAAKYMDCSTKTVRRCTAQGLRHYYVRLAGHKRGILLFRRGDIDRWLRRFRNSPEQDSQEEVLDTGRTNA